MPELSPTDILTAEFNYIAQTATQANEDRARITSLYFVTVGTLVAAIFGASVGAFDESIQRSVRIAFAIIFLGLSLHSLLTILQLVRLRLAWVESAKAMNAVKEYYIAQLPNANMDAAFRWTTDTIPPKFKPDSLSAILAIQVAALGGLALGSSVFFFGLAQQNTWWASSIGLGIIFLIFQFVLYWFQLRPTDKDTSEA